MNNNMYIGKISEYDMSNNWFVLDSICDTKTNSFCYPVPGARRQYYLLPSEDGTQWMTNPVDGILTLEDVQAIKAAKIKVFCMSNNKYIGTITKITQDLKTKNIRYYLDNCIENCCYKDGETFYVRSVEQGKKWQILPQPALSSRLGSRLGSRNLDILSKINLSEPLPFDPYPRYRNENNLETNLETNLMETKNISSLQRYPGSDPSLPRDEFEKTTPFGGGFSKKNKRKLKKTKNKRK